MLVLWELLEHILGNVENHKACWGKVIIAENKRITKSFLTISNSLLATQSELPLKRVNGEEVLMSNTPNNEFLTPNIINLPF